MKNTILSLFALSALGASTAGVAALSTDPSLLRELVGIAKAEVSSVATGFRRAPVVTRLRAVFGINPAAQVLDATPVYTELAVGDETGFARFGRVDGTSFGLRASAQGPHFTGLLNVTPGLRSSIDFAGGAAGSPPNLVSSVDLAANGLGDVAASFGQPAIGAAPPAVASSSATIESAPAGVPEPASWLLLLAGFAALSWAHRRRLAPSR